jgi:hypothetical protein
VICLSTPGWVTRSRCFHLAFFSAMCKLALWRRIYPTWTSPIHHWRPDQRLMGSRPAFPRRLQRTPLPALYAQPPHVQPLQDDFHGRAAFSSRVTTFVPPAWSRRRSSDIAQRGVGHRMKHLEWKARGTTTGGRRVCREWGGTAGLSPAAHPFRGHFDMITTTPCNHLNWPSPANHVFTARSRGQAGPCGGLEYDLGRRSSSTPLLTRHSHLDRRFMVISSFKAARRRIVLAGGPGPGWAARRARKDLVTYSPVTRLRHRRGHEPGRPVRDHAAATTPH